MIFAPTCAPPVLAAYTNLLSFFCFFNDTATTEIYTLSLHDALPICAGRDCRGWRSQRRRRAHARDDDRSEEHTSELQSLTNLVCRLLLDKKKRYRSLATRAGGARFLWNYHEREASS